MFAGDARLLLGVGWQPKPLRNKASAREVVVFCIICGRLGDFTETLICASCSNVIAKNNRMVAVLSLLAEAYKEVQSTHLRQRIENVLFPRNADTY